ncbi:MAG: NTP transferase domain-containing protein [Nitrospina sp.]|nr:NTP transferase domain-containing protein [Nitrospina sp.]
MEAIILAGGLGTRLRSAVPSLPKPMAPIKGKPFLGYLFDYWLHQGIKHFILSVGYKYEVIHERFGTKYKDADVSYAIENEPLGTGGGLLLSIKQLRSKEPFLLLNGDTFFAVNLNNLFKYHKNCRADMTLSLVEIKNNKRYSGVLLDKQGLVYSIDSPTDSSKTSIANGGVYMIENDLFRKHLKRSLNKCSLEEELLPQLLIQKKRIAGFASNDSFVDIGIPHDYNLAANVLSQHV